jgi:hypothetical protein
MFPRFCGRGLWTGVAARAFPTEYSNPARRWISETKQKMETMRDSTAAAALSVAFLLSNRAVQGHLPEFGGDICGSTVLEVGARTLSTCASD